MCGRYTLYSDIENTEIKKMVEDINRKYNVQIGMGDIFPSDIAPIIKGNTKERELTVMQWGYHNPFKKGLIINARSETVMEKKMFRGDFETRRCLIPTAGFYEWDKQKNQFLFNSHHVLYLWGIYKPFEGKNNYVILTKGSNQTVSEIHDRIPVIIPAGMLDHWLHDYNNALDLLKEDTTPLITKQIQTAKRSS